MKDITRQAYNDMQGQLCVGYGVENVTQKFTATPTAQQRLRDAVVELDTFLQKINVIGVDELIGQNIYGGVTGRIASRTDTNDPNKERVPRNLLGLTPRDYKLSKTNFDVFITYYLLDQWAKFGNLAEKYAEWFRKQIARDRVTIGWHGTQAAADTNLTTYPMLQDVNKGWMQYMREVMPANILKEGVKDSGVLKIGTGGDFSCLDVAVHDMVQGIPEFLRDDLIVLVGADLVAKDQAAVYEAIAAKPSEKNQTKQSLTTYGGLPHDTPTGFPARGLAITSYENLSIYEQDGSWRRNLDEEAKKDRTCDYNSVNEGYVVEVPEKFVAVEFGNVRIPDGKGGWT